ncbi:MAG TPA: exosortase/archaeosortase family protein [Fimbriiglobus sp.]|nr:exosortase/archaeosortase family protein [Fimbriiglobus sp.]
MAEAGRWSPGGVVLTAVLLGAVVWSFWPSLMDMASRWRTDPQYSHGFIVPLFSGYLLWSRRSLLAAGSNNGRWYGVAILALGLVLRTAGVLFFVNWFEAIALPVCLAGVTVAVAGWTGLRWAYPAILFLGFMIPLPFAIQTAMSAGLQRIATQASTYLLVTAGVPAVAEGNVILLSNDVRIGVVEACSGLGMLVTFFALSTGVALVLHREPVWGRVLVVLSTIPVAIAVNVVRITATGFLYSRSQDEWARWVFHDVAGWLMMPVGVAMFFALLWATHRIIVPTETHRSTGGRGALGISTFGRY